MPKVEYLNYDSVEKNGWSIEDDDLFNKADNAELEDKNYGCLDVDEDESILEAAESVGLEWPYGCRQGMCASCASFILKGKIDMSGQQVLSDDEVENGVRVTCIGTPDAEEIQIVYNFSGEY